MESCKTKKKKYGNKKARHQETRNTPAFSAEIPFLHFSLFQSCCALLGMCACVSDVHRFTMEAPKG